MFDPADAFRLDLSLTPATETDYARLRDEASALAGAPWEGARRAALYREMFRHSGRNHVFPLIAAHGALWALGYFRFGLRLGRVMALPYAVSPDGRRRRVAALDAFALAFREINRRVCVETYTFYRLTGEPRFSHMVARKVPSRLAAALAGCHDARCAGRDMSLAEKRDLFAAFFLWEQDNIVGPDVDRAVAAFDWPLLKRIALTPNVAFAYLPHDVSLAFDDFADKAERIARGLQAFDAAARVGWDAVETTLWAYGETFATERAPARHSSCAVPCLSR